MTTFFIMAGLAVIGIVFIWWHFRQPAPAAPASDALGSAAVTNVPYPPYATSTDTSSVGTGPTMADKGEAARYQAGYDALISSGVDPSTADTTAKKYAATLTEIASNPESRTGRGHF